MTISLNKHTHTMGKGEFMDVGGLLNIGFTLKLIAVT